MQAIFHIHRSNAMDRQVQPLSRDRMEELLADYAFNALPEDDAQQFERSLPYYPDIREEVEKVRAAFAQFDREEFLERRTRRARSLSVHVQERLAQKRSLWSGNRALRHLWPALVLTVLLVAVFTPGGLFLPDRSAHTEQPAVAGSNTVAAPATPPVVSREEVAQIVEDAQVGDPLEVALALPDRTPLDDSDLDELGTAVFSADDLISDEMAQALAENVLYPMSDYSLSGGLYNDLQEAELQQLLEELDNNDIL